MHSFEEITALMERSVRELTLPAEPALLYDPIRYTLDAGGKRIRPLLALGSCALFTDELKKAVPAAMAIEVFHNFTLLHDDIMDQSALRRGRETVHVRWNENVAILSGDAMLIYAYQLAALSAPEKLAQVMHVLNRVFTGVCEGQVYDMDFESRIDVTHDEYLRMIGQKTAVLMAGALQVGAILGGADEAAAEQLHQAGMHLGTAFQLQDDLLDTYGEPAIWGKNLGDDIADNKKTYLLIRALETAGSADRKELLALLAARDMDRREKFSAVRAIYATTGVREQTESLILKYFNATWDILDALPVEEHRKEPLRKIVETLEGRKK
jgi:geranylgeranyl diphosphate synthase type II